MGIVSRSATKRVGCAYWRDLLGDFDALGDRFIAVERAFLVNVLHLRAQILSLVDEPYEAILDGEIDVGAVFDLAREVALGFDGQDLATVLRISEGYYGRRES